MKTITTVILAGGEGRRMNLGSEDYPKQFIRAFDGKSLFQQALGNSVGEVVIFSNKRYIDHIETQLEDYQITADILLEECNRSTLFPILYSCMQYPNQTLLFMPSDHLIVGDFDKFIDKIRQMDLSNKFILFGLHPSFPNSNFGYISQKEGRIIEKPDQTLAKTLIEDGWLWNSGIFCFNSQDMLNVLKADFPDLYEELQNIVSETDGNHTHLNNCDFINTSFDKLLQKTDMNLEIINFTLEWSDLGEVHSFIDKMNVPKITRPWGSYSILDSGNNFKVKLISVNPGEMISLQSHSHRTEYWEVLVGEASITKGDKSFKASSGDKIVIQKGEVHRVENNSLQDIQIVEIQVGEILEETDILRISDKYGRQ